PVSLPLTAGPFFFSVACALSDAIRIAPALCTPFVTWNVLCRRRAPIRGRSHPLVSRAASAPWTPCAERNISRRGRAPIRGRSHPTRFASGTWLAAHGATWLAAHGASHGAMAASASARPDRGVAENNCTLVCAE